MAEPLSAFDVARTRFGFGTSGDPAERQRFAQAGLSPLTSEERMRMERGWGASPLASKESREAMVAEEVRQGIRPAYQLPEAYGGRPEGTTRRAIRMQEAWDAEQAARIQQEKANQQYEMEQKRFAIDAAREMRQQREYDLSVEAGLAKEERESAIQNEAKFIFETIRGGRAIGTNPDGTTRYSEPINLNDPKSVDTLYRMASMPFGMQNPAAKEVVTMMLDDALRIQETNAKTSAEQARADAQARVNIAKELGAYGMSIADFTENGKINFEKANEAIGKAWAEGKETSPEQAETEEQRKSISSRITDAEKKLLEVRARAAAAQRRVEARPTVKDFQTELEAAQIEQGILEDEVNRLNRMLGGEAQPTTTPTGQRPTARDIFGD